MFAEGEHEFTGKTKSALVLPNDASYAVDNGTLELTFNADTVSKARQGIFTKDAYDYVNGGHVGVFLEGNDVVVRIQSDSDSYFVRANDVVSANTDYHLALTFGDGGLSLYLNGDLVASDSYTGGLQGNAEPIVIGANEWASSTGTANVLRDAFDGTIGKVFLYDYALSASKIADLAKGGFVNDGPTATADSAGTAQNTAVVIDVLGNDSDPNGNALYVDSFTDAAHGTVHLNDNGTLSYTPDGGYSGPDTFHYTVTDGMLTSTASVSLGVGEGWLI